MDWKAIRQHLLNATGFDLEITGGWGKSKTINLTMAPNSPRLLTFRTLGSGSMKRVVKIDGEDWVLALAGDSPAAVQDMTGEVRALLELSRDDVRVPEPFVSGIEGEILFELELYNTDSGATKRYPAFIQQFLPYQEMDKLKQRMNFAKDFILNGGAARDLRNNRRRSQKDPGSPEAAGMGRFPGHLSEDDGLRVRVRPAAGEHVGDVVRAAGRTVAGRH